MTQCSDIRATSYSRRNTDSYIFELGHEQFGFMHAGASGLA
jgi:hypothetical protein